MTVAVSTLQAEAFSPVLNWARQHVEEHGGASQSVDPKRQEFQKMSGVFMQLLQNLQSNPLAGGDTMMEGARIIQGLLEGYGRMQQVDHLEKMAKALQQNSFLQAGHIVGKRGLFRADSFHNASDLSLEVPESQEAVHVRLDVFHAQTGQKVAQYNDTLESGLHDLRKKVADLPDGPLHLVAYGSTPQGEPVDVTPYVSVKIDKVLQKNGRLFAESAGQLHPITQLRGVQDPSSPLSSTLRKGL
jgi:flagellar hook assembly protein FlgD